MRIIKNLAFPLLIASVLLFNLARRFDGMLLYWVAAGLMCAGMVMFVVSAIFPGPAGSSVPPSGGLSRYFSPSGGRAADSFYGNMARTGQPAAKDEVPAWVTVLSAVVTLLGAVAFLTGPNGVSARTVIPFAMIPGGVSGEAD